MRTVYSQLLLGKQQKQLPQRETADTEKKKLLQRETADSGKNSCRKRRRLIVRKTAAAKGDG
jgi:hypothetical protein